MLNHIVLMGRLTRDPEIRQTQSGIDVASFSLAVDRDFADSVTGQRQADFIDCVAWRGTAIFAHKYFSKGSMAVVSGRLQIRQWETNNGDKRRTAEVVVDNMYFGGPKKDGENGNQGAPGSQAPTGQSYGGYSAQRAPGGQRQTQSGYGGSYPTSDYGGGFADLTDDDGDLPF